ncbi:MAG: hypothetical protein ABUT20_31335 [Bacteroidota bacterium]
MKLHFSLTKSATFLLLFSLLVVFSCTKEQSGNGSASDQDEQASLVSSQSDAEAELVFNNIFDDAMGASDDVGMAGTGIFGRNGLSSVSDGINPMRITGCFNVLITHATNAVFPVKIVIDFGTTGCPGPDGHIRKGKIITEYTSRLLYPGAIATSTFDGFYVDSIKVEGTHKITNTGTANVRQFTVDVTDAKLSKPSGNYTEWNSHKVITQIEGLATAAYPKDDILKIEGSAHGKAKRGALLVAWESNITEPLVKKFICPWIVKGKVKAVRINTSSTGQWVAELDFGAGDCDNKAIITINGVAHNITLH